MASHTDRFCVTDKNDAPQTPVGVAGRPLNSPPPDYSILKIGSIALVVNGSGVQIGGTIVCWEWLGWAGSAHSANYQTKPRASWEQTACCHDIQGVFA